MMIKLRIDNLGCANCADKMEGKIKELDGLESVSLTFVNKSLSFDCKNLSESLLNNIDNIISSVEADAHLNKDDISKILNKGNSYRFSIKNLGCANCASKMEDKIRKLEGLSDAYLTFANKSLSFNSNNVNFDLIEKINTIISSIESDAQLDEDDIKKYLNEKNSSYIKDNNLKEKGSLLYKIKNIDEKYKILTSLVFFILALFVKNKTLNLFFVIASFLVVGLKIIIKACKNIIRMDFLDENFLMSIAGIGAFLIGEGHEGAAVMLFYSIGEYFQNLAVEKSRRSITALMDLAPNTANLLVDGKEEKVNPEKVAIGDTIIVKAGERVPIDSVISKGEAYFDTSSITGESVPSFFATGDEVISGFINKGSVIEAKTTTSYENSKASKIIEMVEENLSKKARTEKFISRFAKIYTPVVVGTAIMLIILGSTLTKIPMKNWIYRSLVFLVASCPCALVVSIPLTFYAGIGRSSSEDILVKGGSFLEIFSKVKNLLFDKTGTLTKGSFEVVSVNPSPQIEKDVLLNAAYIAETGSSHPIAKAILAYWKYDGPLADKITDISGHGTAAEIKGSLILSGNEKLMKKYSIDFTESKGGGSSVYIAVDGKYYGNIVVSDKIKDEAKDSIAKLKNYFKITMLTGDNFNEAKKVSDRLNIDNFKASLLPEEKTHFLESFMEKGEKVAFIGDGINDAPVLSRASIGIAMGKAGSDIAIESADIVIIKDDLAKLDILRQISKKTMLIAKENLIFALAFKLIVLTLGAVGYTNMWVAVFADVGVTIICVLNAIRVLKFKIN